MQKSTARTLARAIAPGVLLLSACSAGSSYAETEACNRVNAWNTGGQVPDRFDQAMAAAQDALGDTEDSPLADPLAKLAGSAEDERVANVEAFMAICDDQGWEPPEG